MADLYVDQFGLSMSGPYANRPANPTSGSQYFATDQGVLYIYNGASWIEFSSGAAASANEDGALVLRDANGSFAGTIGTFTHLETDTTTSPTFSAGGNLGTSPTVTYSGTDVAFTLTAQPGSSGQSGTTVGTVTYTKAFAKAPAVVIIPQNATASNVSGNLHIYAISTTTGFTIFTGGGNLTNLAASSWIFLSIG